MEGMLRSQLQTDARQAYEQEDYSAACELYSTLWIGAEKPDKWDGYNYARALRKCGRVTDALDVCREVYKLDKEFERNNNEYGWCVYQLHVKKTNDEIKADEGDFFRAAEAITQIARHSRFSPYERTVFRVLKYLKADVKRRSIAKQVLEWTDKLDPVDLSADPQQFERDGDIEESASAREEWYMRRSSALFSLAEYDECINVCLQAVESFQRLHHGNQTWFKMRIANSKGNLGRVKEAVDELKNLLRFKPEWFIHLDLAVWLNELGEIDNAYTETVQAALGHRKSDKLENKWKLFLLMGQLQHQLGNDQLAKSHVLLAYKLRVERQWGVPKELSSAIQQMDVNIEDIRSASDVYQELRHEWQNQLPRMHGTVKMVKPEREFGFIVGEDNQDYHFVYRDVRTPRNRLNRGLEVTFLTKPSFDRAKQRETTIAVDICEAE